MLKKGFSYIDVAVSVGIFLIALSIGFVFMRPAIKQENPGPILLPLLKEGFENETYWKIYRIPFFIKNTMGVPLGTDGVKIDVPFNFSSQHVNLTDIDLNFIPFYYTLLNPKGFNISFTAELNPSKTIYYLMYSEEYSSNPTTGEAQNLIPSENYDTTFGVREELTGISLSKFIKLNNYDQLKTNFRIPKNNDFSIIIYTTNNYTKIGEYTPVEPSDEQPIYVLEYTSFILYENSTRMPVYISLRLW